MFYHRPYARHAYNLLLGQTVVGMLALAYMASAIAGDGDLRGQMFLLGDLAIIVGVAWLWYSGSATRFRQSNGFGVVGLGLALMPVTTKFELQILLVPAFAATFVVLWAVICDRKVRPGGVKDNGVRWAGFAPVLGFGVLFQLLAEFGHSVTVDWWVVIGGVLLAIFVGLPTFLAWFAQYERAVRPIPRTVYRPRTSVNTTV
jgi:hypothetical protein